MKLLRGLLAPGGPWLPRLVSAALVATGMLPVLRFAWHRLPNIEGWEADDIARNLVAGHGYSFSAKMRWLWDNWNSPAGEFFPTAWVDPVYTFILAGAHALFGAHAYLAMYALCFVLIGVIFVCAYLVAARFGGPWTGVIAVGLLAAHTRLYTAFLGDMTNSALAAAALMLAMLAAVRYFEEPNRGRFVTAGLTIGLLVLTCPLAQFFIPAIAVAIAWYHRADWRLAVRRALACILLAACVIAPWTLRNYATFGEFVLVRTGSGQILWDSTVGPAETFMTGAAQSSAPPPWRSSGPWDAVQKMTEKRWRLPMHRYQVQAVMASPPHGYEFMNEAQRDRFYLSRTMGFLRANPGVATGMALAKLAVFAMVFGPYGFFLLALALTGALRLARDPRSWPLSLVAATCSVPFALIIAYYGRYRAPIEPVIAVLAAVGIGGILARILPGKLLLDHSPRQRRAIPE